MYKLFQLTAASWMLGACASTSVVNNKPKVQKFYDYLSNPGSNEHAKEFMAVATPDWKSISGYQGGDKSREAFKGQLGGFAKFIPDLKWEVMSMHQDGDTVVVRSRATGTPVGPFMGVDGEGRGFDILTIDIHEMKEGMIVRSFHVEDWAGALRQLAGPNAKKKAKGKASLSVVMAFMDAMGKGEMEKMSSLMADDMVWHNEGDAVIPWIGPWKGKTEIFKFLKTFSEGSKTTLWKNEDVLASGDTVAMYGKMKLMTTKSGKESKEFTYSLRAKVRDGKIILWNWFEDSYEVSRTFRGRR